MAEAFELFAKRFSKAYGIAAWAVTSSYDRSVKGRDAAGRRYRSTVEKLRSSMLQHYPASGCDSMNIGELVRRATEGGSPVAGAIKQEALRADEQLNVLDREETGTFASETVPWNVIRLGFVFTPTFRHDFKVALVSDGFSDDAQGLWAGIDRIAESLGGQKGSNVDELMRCQREIVEALVLATLRGPKDYAQLSGYDAGDTPSLLPISQHIDAGTDKRGARLQRISPTGPHPWDYTTISRESWKFAEPGARVGRDERWTNDESYTPIRISAIGVSRRHCTIFWNGIGWTLRDEGSRNGTLLVRPDESSEILFDSEEAIHPGDIICLAPEKVGPGYDGTFFRWRFDGRGACLRFEVAADE